MYKCFVAIGDSLTEGYGDVVNGIENFPFPNLIARELKIEAFHNFGKSGARSDEVLNLQFPLAKELKPDLVSITAGGNDFIQLKWSKRKYENRMRSMINYFYENNTTIITCTLPDFTDYLKIPSLAKKILKRWLIQCNSIMNSLSREYNTIHIDFWDHPAVLDMSNWSLDYFHPNAKGYLAIAEAYLDILRNRNSKNIKED